MRKLFSLAFTLTLLIAACQPAVTANPAPVTQPAATPVAAATKGATALVPAPTTGNDPLVLATAAISEIEGTAEQRNDAQTNWATAAVGQTLNVGNQVRTGPESVAAIQFAEGAITRLGPDTLFTVSELGGDSQNPLIKLQLAAGQLFVLITGSLGTGSVEVETPIGVAAVRGSLMSVEVTDDGRIVVTCLETTGNCRLENESGSVEIQSGQQAEIISAGEPPTPAEQIDDSQLNEWFQNNPEAQAIVLEDSDADGYTILQGDCDDNDSTIHPDLEDTPNDGVDQNCDGDDGVQLDEDGDGYTFFDGDCDDANPEVNPGAADVAQDGLDANCDGFDGVDEGLYDGDYDDDPVADVDDNCPDVYNPDQFDSDGDGVGDLCDNGDGLNSVDTDGDGLPDSFDQCPDTFGSADHGGCPPDSSGSFDTDGDGLTDDVDQCPHQFGKPELGGCPDTSSGDRDSDGVPDDVDQCPDQFGQPELGGCPDTSGGDRDGDGVPDDVDQCPDLFGQPELGGCPDTSGG
ncbi:MAG: MopE-related protein, partial [Chloroflexota bacterium]